MLSAIPASPHPTEAPVELQQTQQRRHLIIHLPADRMVQLTDISQVCQALEEAVDAYREPRPRIVFSFAGVQYISSTFLGRLMGLSKRVSSRGGRLVVADMEPAVRDAFCLTQMQRQIPLYRTTQEAISGRSGPWLMLLALATVNALLGLRGLTSLLHLGWPVTPDRALDSIALACFIAYIPLPVAVLLTRNRFCRLDRAFQWTLVALFVFVTVCALPAYLAVDGL